MVKLPSMTFGQALALVRRNARLNLREMAALIKKEDGRPMSFQYLSDLENDRRNPPSDHLIDEIARVAGVSRYFLYVHARRIPSDFPVRVNAEQAQALYERMQRELKSVAA